MRKVKWDSDFGFRKGNPRAAIWTEKASCGHLASCSCSVLHLFLLVTLIDEHSTLEVPCADSKTLFVSRDSPSKTPGTSYSPS